MDRDETDIRRRAGQRFDECPPGQSSPESAGGSNAAGTPGGGLAAGGLSGTNAGDGSYDEDNKLEDAMSAGIYDTNGDNIFEDEPESDREGRATDGPEANR